MEKREMSSAYRTGIAIVILATIGVVFFAMGLAFSVRAQAAERLQVPTGQEASAPTSGASAAKKPRVVYPKSTELDFEGAKIEGEIRNPGEFYFQRKPEEKFDSLVKRRKNFHREMLRDVVMAK